MSVLMLVRIELIRFHPARCAIDTLAYDPVTSVSQRAPLGGGVDLHIRWIISRCNFHFSPLPYPFFFLSPLKQPRETIFVYGSLVSRIPNLLHPSRPRLDRQKHRSLHVVSHVYLKLKCNVVILP